MTLMQVTVVKKILGKGFCRHVGLGYGNTDDEDPEYGNIGSIADGQEPSDEAVILRKDLKEFRKIIKLQRKHLEKWDERCRQITC